MILFSAEAILASSNSNKVWSMNSSDGTRRLRSSTDSTISTSLIHITASVRSCKKIHTSILNLNFQQENVVEVQSEVLKCAVFVGWSAPQSFENLPSLGSNEFLAEGPDHHRIENCVWDLTFTRYMRWCVFRHVRNPRIESTWMRWWRRCRWIYKNVSRDAMRIPNIWLLIIAA